MIAGALFWTRAGEGLNPNQVYTVLAVVAIISQPLATILVSAPALSGALASFPRIQRFLCLEEMADSRSVNDSNTATKLDNVFINSELSTPLLQSINLQINPGDAFMFLGPVGCGKTVFLKSLIGEIQPHCGFIEAPSCPIGYSDQVAWLENISIRDNICHDDYNAVLYRAVVTACALAPDLEALPNGDMTIVGSNGTRLSGGQRQRVVCRF